MVMRSLREKHVHIKFCSERKNWVWTIMSILMF